MKILFGVPNSYQNTIYFLVTVEQIRINYLTTHLSIYVYVLT